VSAVACPNAYKLRYATVEAARREAAALPFITGGVVMRANLCRCGWWHLTRRQAIPLPAELAERSATIR
jgi:hypothetical protein